MHVALRQPQWPKSHVSKPVRFDFVFRRLCGSTKSVMVTMTETFKARVIWRPEQRPLTLLLLTRGQYFSSCGTYRGSFRCLELLFQSRSDPFQSQERIMLFSLAVGRPRSPSVLSFRLKVVWTFSRVNHFLSFCWSRLVPRVSFFVVSHRTAVVDTVGCGCSFLPETTKTETEKT